MIANHLSLILLMLIGGRSPTQCFATFANTIVKLAEDVGYVKKPAGIRKRVTFIGFVDECYFKEVSVVSAL